MTGMSRRRPTRVSDQLRQAIEAADESRYRISKATGISAPVLCRFVHSDCGLSLANIDKLCLHLGLELKPVRPSRRKGK
jgi:hypothetical protein